MFQILSYRMKNTFGRDNEDDGNDESANLFNIAIQAVAGRFVHFSDAAKRCVGRSSVWQRISPSLESSRSTV